LFLPFVSQGEQRLGYELMDVPKKKSLAKGSLPLTKGSRVSWVGFSDSFVSSFFFLLFSTLRLPTAFLPFVCPSFLEFMIPLAF